MWRRAASLTSFTSESYIHREPFCHRNAFNKTMSRSQHPSLFHTSNTTTASAAVTASTIPMVTPPHCSFCSSGVSKVHTTDNSSFLYTDWAAGDVICRHCGMVLEESIRDESPEWNTYEGDHSQSKQRTAGPVNPLDGTLPATSFSATCYGSSGNNTALRQQLARIQHVRDHAISQQQSKLLKDVAIDLAVKQKKLQRRKRNLQEMLLQDHDDMTDDDDDEDRVVETDPPPPKSMVLIEEHMEQQIEREQALLEERTRVFNKRKWTLRTDGDTDDEEPDNTQRRTKKRTKKERTMLAQAQETLQTAVKTVRSLHPKGSTEMIDSAISRFQTYAATHDKLPGAACAAILQQASNDPSMMERCCQAFGTNAITVKKMSKQIAVQFPKWNAPTVHPTKQTLDRLHHIDTLTRDAILRIDCPDASAVVAAVYFCNAISQKLEQLGLSTHKSRMVTVAKLAQQTGIPASRIRNAYKNADRNAWLEKITSVIPQATMVQQLLPNKAV